MWIALPMSNASASSFVMDPDAPPMADGAERIVVGVAGERTIRRDPPPPLPEDYEPEASWRSTSWSPGSECRSERTR